MKILFAPIANLDSILVSNQKGPLIDILLGYRFSDGDYFDHIAIYLSRNFALKEKKFNQIDHFLNDFCKQKSEETKKTITYQLQFHPLNNIADLSQVNVLVDSFIDDLNHLKNISLKKMNPTIYLSCSSSNLCLDMASILLSDRLNSTYDVKLIQTFTSLKGQKNFNEDIRKSYMKTSLEEKNSSKDILFRQADFNLMSGNKQENLYTKMANHYSYHSLYKEVLKNDKLSSNTELMKLINLGVVMSDDNISDYQKVKNDYDFLPSYYHHERKEEDYLYDKIFLQVLRCWFLLLKGDTRSFCSSIEGLFKESLVFCLHELSSDNSYKNYFGTQGYKGSESIDLAALLDRKTCIRYYRLRLEHEIYAEVTRFSKRTEDEHRIDALGLGGIVLYYLDEKDYSCLKGNINRALKEYVYVPNGQGIIQMVNGYSHVSDYKESDFFDPDKAKIVLKSIMSILYEITKKDTANFIGQWSESSEDIYQFKVLSILNSKIISLIEA